MNKLVKNQLSPIEKLSDRMLGSLFGELFTDPFFSRLPGSINTPSMNIVEREGGYDIQLAVPGLDKEQVSIEVKDNILTIASENSYKNEEDTDSYRHREFGFSKFTKSLTLPQDTDVDAIRAHCDKGILTVSVPTGKEVADLPVSIEIE